MVAKLFRTDRLTERQLSVPVEFIVLLDADKTFLRVVAHFKDNVVLGGAAPTILIKAGLGEPTAVDEGAGPVNIPGSGGATVATATSRRTLEDRDTFLVTIDHNAPSGPWQFQIKNNEPEALAFNGFISHDEDETLKPWMEIEAEDDDGIRLGGVARTTARMLVRNLGPVSLEIQDEPGDPFGDEGSPAFILELPDPIRPHRTDTVVVECEAREELGSPGLGTVGRTHRFTTNDPNPDHVEISFGIVTAIFTATRCRFISTFTPGAEDDGCREFTPRFPPDEFQCATCFHDAGFHGLPSDPNPFPQ